MNIVLFACGVAVVTVATGEAIMATREAVHCDELAGCNQQGDQHQKPIVTVPAMSSVASTTHVMMMGLDSFPNTIGEGEYEIIWPDRRMTTISAST
jgi:hypothetical protein